MSIAEDVLTRNLDFTPLKDALIRKGLMPHDYLAHVGLYMAGAQIAMTYAMAQIEAEIQLDNNPDPDHKEYLQHRLHTYRRLHDMLDNDVHGWMLTLRDDVENEEMFNTFVTYLDNFYEYTLRCLETGSEGSA